LIAFGKFNAFAMVNELLPAAIVPVVAGLAIVAIF